MLGINDERLPMLSVYKVSPFNRARRSSLGFIIQINLVPSRNRPGYTYVRDCPSRHQQYLEYSKQVSIVLGGSSEFYDADDVLTASGFYSHIFEPE